MSAVRKDGGPVWKPPGTPIPKADPAAPKPRRDYIAEAVAVLGIKATPANINTALTERGSVVGAIIVAQSLDRLGEKIVEAAAITSYKRS